MPSPSISTPKDLKELTKSFLVRYRTGDNDMVNDFYVPCLKRAKTYDRAVGYFTSSGLACAASGLAEFISSGGKMRLVASPHLTEEDAAALSGIVEKEEFLREIIHLPEKNQIESLLIRERLNALAWLVTRGQLEVKLALLTDTKGRIQRGIYHEKIGIFGDEVSNCVGFAGSANETQGGLINNFESIRVFWSWNDERGDLVSLTNDFEALWENRINGVEVIDFSEASTELLSHYKLEHKPIEPCSLELRKRNNGPLLSVAEEGIPSKPDWLELRDYQKQAIQNWVAKDCKGMLKMATGSGKTITALAAAQILQNKGVFKALIVVCPYKHLVEQWKKEAEKFNFRPILAYENKNHWTKAIDSELGLVNQYDEFFLCVITTNVTFSLPPFQARISGFPNNTVIVCDEVHNMGAKHLSRSLPDSIPYRLGLSATPERWFDDEGTDSLTDYFGAVVKPEFTLKDALDSGALTKYKYFPILVELTEIESQKYLELSEKIAQRASRVGNDNDDDGLKHLRIERSRLISKAENKMDALRELMASKANESHFLFYCGDSSIEDDEGALVRHVEGVARELNENLHFKVATFTSEDDIEERIHLGERLHTGELQGLVAIRCLDEGVDIPSVRNAVILASSTNPRQFIQRRGRILRKSHGKSFANIYDMIVIPPHSSIASDTERGLIRRELKRFVEFSDLALNAASARLTILDIMKKYSLLDM